MTNSLARWLSGLDGDEVRVYIVLINPPENVDCCTRSCHCTRNEWLLWTAGETVSFQFKKVRLAARKSRQMSAGELQGGISRALD